MNATTIPMHLWTSVSPFASDEIAVSPGDIVEGGMEEWLEDEALPGFRVWQLAGIILSILFAIIIGLCCCIRFRIPRTKQEIEADYIRKKITKCFRKELSKINNTDMDDMDLRTALDKMRAEFNLEIRGTQKTYRKAKHKTQLNAMFSGIRDRLGKWKNTDFDDVI